MKNGLIFSFTCEQAVSEFKNLTGVELHPTNPGQMSNKMRTTQKRVKECFKNLTLNFSELINHMIWYDTKNMDDWGNKQYLNS